MLVKSDNFLNFYISSARFTFFFRELATSRKRWNILQEQPHERLWLSILDQFESLLILEHQSIQPLSVRRSDTMNDVIAEHPIHLEHLVRSSIDSGPQEKIFDVSTSLHKRPLRVSRSNTAVSYSFSVLKLRDLWSVFSNGLNSIPRKLNESESPTVSTHRKKNVKGENGLRMSANLDPDALMEESWDHQPTQLNISSDARNLSPKHKVLQRIKLIAL